MRTPSPAQLLEAWERGGGQPAAARGLLLLGISCDEQPAETLPRLPLGRRDALLLQLRQRLFGTGIDSVAHCPQCATLVEVSFRGDDLLAAGDGAHESAESHEYRSPDGEVRVRFRLPDSEDELALASCGSIADACALLLERCVLDASASGAPCAPHELPEAAQAGLAQAMADADPQADLQLALTCPSCAHEWQPAFDIGAFLWQELQAWTLRLLRDIDMLARHYHWSEADILALSPRRRQAYLELCAS